ncbi:MAG: LuxR family transcriptional regulator [Roseibium sp.]|uniref:helix-turn-helix transcriptional regulator n=1 Tax=Roseibium sp. TaxID=1936156 RepID=UPI00261457A0|nr:LuxR family transcriptional regulator [Roseibium sp.]MCV0428991.1 LuxR family transcriptional regulator [Roseibium sp.]
MDLILGETQTTLIGADVLENLVIIVLVVSLIGSALEVRRVMTRQKRLEQQVKVASGAFANLLEEHFESWRLTPSEGDVALLALKGFSIAEMASVRKTAEGTVKAQCNAIYRKAGVSGRTQLLSLFIDELLYGALDEQKEKAVPVAETQS